MGVFIIRETTTIPQEIPEYTRTIPTEQVKLFRFATKIRKARSNFTLLHSTVDPDKNKRLEAVYLSLERRDFELD